MASSSAQEPSEWDEDPAWSRPDPMTAEEREAWLDHLAEADEAPDVEEEEDPEDCAPLTAEELAEVREGAAAGPAVWAGLAGRRGPGQPGSARVYPGESCSPAASFGSGMALDVMPGVSGPGPVRGRRRRDDDSYTGVSDDELLGVLAAWDRLEATWPPGSWPRPPTDPSQPRARLPARPGRAGCPSA